MIAMLLAFVGGGLAALIILMGLIGMFLPRDHMAARQAIFHRTPAELYAAANNFAAMASWRRGLQGVEMLPMGSGQVRYRENWGRRAMTYEVIENEPLKKLVLKIADEKLPFGGAWTIEFVPVPEGARVRIIENGEIKNALFRFLARFAFGYTATMEAYLRDLGKKFGEEVAPQPASAG